MEKEICPVKGCNNEATEKFGPVKVCVECFTKCAYDMEPLILEHPAQEDKT